VYYRSDARAAIGRPPGAEGARGGPSRSPEGLAADRSKLTAMISSEVQRTLVKSPPELWAEISDPESLARHLGEFGEIRITRVQPEQKVEWEGDRASGTVVIKPSGWGTKVKLTVTRELAPNADDVAALDDGDGPGPALAAAPPTPTPAADIATAGETEREPLLESAPQAEAARELTTAPELESAPEPEPASDQSPSVVEIDLSSEPQAAVTAAPAAAIEPAPQPERTERVEQASEPVARRGFFARLFARRRGAAPHPPAVPTPEVDRDDAQEPIPGEPVAEEPVSDEAVADELSADEPNADEPLADETPAADLSADELAADEPTVDEATGDEAIAVAALNDVSPDLPAPEPDRDDRVMPAAHERPADPAKGSQTGLAGELAAAEEVTAEQVHAVLTGVLDRLGSAHHRPFSRS
jgi:hypothetical protein